MFCSRSGAISSNNKLGIENWARPHTVILLKPTKSNFVAEHRAQLNSQLLII